MRRRRLWNNNLANRRLTECRKSSTGISRSMKCRHRSQMNLQQNSKHRPRTSRRGKDASPPMMPAKIKHVQKSCVKMFLYFCIRRRLWDVAWTWMEIRASFMTLILAYRFLQTGVLIPHLDGRSFFS